MGEENEEKTCKLGTGDPRNWESRQEWGGGEGRGAVEMGEPGSSWDNTAPLAGEQRREVGLGSSSKWGAKAGSIQL